MTEYDMEKDKIFNELFAMADNFTYCMPKSTKDWIMCRAAFEYGMEYSKYSIALLVGNPMYHPTKPDMGKAIKEADFAFKKSIYGET